VGFAANGPDVHGQLGQANEPRGLGLPSPGPAAAAAAAATAAAVTGAGVSAAGDRVPMGRERVRNAVAALAAALPAQSQHQGACLCFESSPTEAGTVAEPEPGVPLVSGSWIVGSWE